MGLSLEISLHLRPTALEAQPLMLALPHPFRKLGFCQGFLKSIVVLPALHVDREGECLPCRSPHRIFTIPMVRYYEPVILGVSGHSGLDDILKRLALGPFLEVLGCIDLVARLYNLVDLVFELGFPRHFSVHNFSMNLHSVATAAPGDGEPVGQEDVALEIQAEWQTCCSAMLDVGPVERRMAGYQAVHMNVA